MTNSAKCAMFYFENYLAKRAVWLDVVLNAQAEIQRLDREYQTKKQECLKGCRDV
jgi:hypothetical protein